MKYVFILSDIVIIVGTVLCGLCRDSFCPITSDNSLA